MVAAQPTDNVELRSARVVASALWAAAGDALGWITELGRESTVHARTGSDRVNRPVDWVRRIGGRGGVQVPLPAGTYSDDTQLRLAVCRAISGDGTFDVEAFARVELTTWQGYALGAGLGTKAAAANLAKRGVNWFSNFFDNRDQKYVNAGGNGAAMRVQPHAWLRQRQDDLVLAVLRDALTTHGHPHGFCGAVLHALAVSRAVEGELLDPFRLDDVSEALMRIPEITKQDRQLDAFWRPAWESASGRSLHQAIEATLDELKEDLSNVRRDFEIGGPRTYGNVLKRLQLTDSRFRGSGLKTSLAATLLAWLQRDRDPRETLIAAANELGSDTDTIATMAGAICGAVSGSSPDWPIQDREYIELEAERVAAIGRGEQRDGFNYPDLARWQPPATQSDSVARTDDAFVVVGLGRAVPEGDEYRSGDAIWQWMRLSFGQTILAKRRAEVPTVDQKQLPKSRRTAQIHPVDRVQSPADRHPDLPFEGVIRQPPTRNDDYRERKDSQGGPTLDQITDQVINSDFDPYVIGRAFTMVLERRGQLEDAISFAAIVGKARLARLRRRSR